MMLEHKALRVAKRIDFRPRALQPTTVELPHQEGGRHVIEIPERHKQSRRSGVEQRTGQPE